MPRSLLDILVERYPRAKRTTLRRMIDDRRVLIDGVPARHANETVGENQKVTTKDRLKEVGRDALPPPFAIVYEDDDVLVIDKLAGLLTSTVPREKRPTAIALVRGYLAAESPDARAGLIHRLDRDASGLLVFSKNHQAFRSLKQQFFKHAVDRIYTAVVDGNLKPDKGRIRSRLVELPDGSVRSTPNADYGELAVSDYQVLKTAGGISLVRVTLQTGRKHQIRVHLAERGTPILGDPIYATPNTPAAPRLLLLSTGLSFDHPRSGKRMHFKLDLIEPMRAHFR